MKTFSIVTLFILISAFISNEKQAHSPGNLITDSVASKTNNTAWKLGEVVKYRVHYGIINAGIIEMEVEPQLKELAKREVYHLHGRGRSVSGFDWFFKVRDHFESYVDREALVPLRFTKQMQEGGYKDHDVAYFNHVNLKVVSNKKGTVQAKPGVQDLLSAIYYARNLDVSKAKFGDEFPVSIYLDGEIHDLKIKYIGKEIIDTDLGKVRAIKIIPMVVADRVFKEKEGLTLWVSDDDNKLPLRVKAELAVGSLKVDITKHSGLRHPLNMVK